MFDGKEELSHASCSSRSVVFISASLGVMSVKGRSGHSGFLDWAWWNGLVGLIMTIVCFFALLCLLFDMTPNAHAMSAKLNQKMLRYVWSLSAFEFVLLN